MASPSAPASLLFTPLAGMPPDNLPPSAAARRETLRKLTLAGVLAFTGMTTHARADTITVRTAEIRPEEDGYVLNAEFDLTINSTLEEALQRGVPLYFILELEIFHPRWYWLDEKVLSVDVQYRITWNALTQQYRISSGLFAQTLYSLEEVERFLSRVTSRPVARRDQLQKGLRYDAALRLRLDTNQLPKPFQVNALTSKEWSLQSDWSRWGFTA